MKKHIGRSIFLTACILIAGNVYGQGMVTSGAVVSSALSWPNHPKALQGQPRFSAEAADLSISYYEPSAPTYSWIAPANWGTIEIYAFTERITLPSDSGFVDSVRIVFDAISGDSINVVLDPDILLSTPLGDYHVDESWYDNLSSSFATGEIYPSRLIGPGAVTVAFPHTRVPKNFHVYLVPSYSTSGFTASFSVRGDSEGTIVRTADNCHSTYICVNLSTSQTESDVIDSNLTPSGFMLPIYSNLYITAFVSSAPSSAPSSVTSDKSEASISVFPNPSTSFIQIQGVAENSNVELLDQLGRSVLSSQINGNDRLDVSQIQPGQYELIVHSENDITITPVIIQR